MALARPALALATQSAVQRTRVRNGMVTEAAVDALHAVCLRAGVARVRKIPTPTVGPHGAMRYAKKSGVDYVGVLRGGRAVFAEAKRADGARLSLSRVEPHQRAELDWATEHGALALLLVVFHGGPLAAVYAVEWADVRGRTSVTRAQLEAGGARVRAGEAYLARWCERAGTAPAERGR